MSTARVLVLDDEPETAATIALLAETAGHVAVSTVDPQEFLELHDTWAPTHLVVDLLMPDMDGIDVLAALAERSCAAAIIITSGVESRVIQAASRFAAEKGLSIVGLLPKPVGLVDLTSLLDSTAGPTGPGTEALRLTELGGRIGPDDLAAALADPDGLRVAYQPKVRCGSGRLAGFEALARWDHPELGAIPPALFIPLAEQHDLIEQLTDRVLEQALAWFSASTPRGGITMSVNISARTLGDDRFVARLVAHCRTHDVRPASLILELTESSRSQDSVMSLRLLTRLRMQGFQLSLDDFGTGYSSMTRLARLPFSEIKIDRSFVSSAVASDESCSVVHSIIDLGRNLGLVHRRRGRRGRGDPATARRARRRPGPGLPHREAAVPEAAAAWTPASGS